MHTVCYTVPKPSYMAADPVSYCSQDVPPWLHLILDTPRPVEVPSLARRPTKTMRLDRACEMVCCRLAYLGHGRLAVRVLDTGKGLHCSERLLWAAQRIGRAEAGLTPDVDTQPLWGPQPGGAAPLFPSRDEALRALCAPLAAWDPPVKGSGRPRQHGAHAVTDVMERLPEGLGEEVLEALQGRGIWEIERALTGVPEDSDEVRRRRAVHEAERARVQGYHDAQRQRQAEVMEAMRARHEAEIARCSGVLTEEERQRLLDEAARRLDVWAAHAAELRAKNDEAAAWDRALPGKACAAQNKKGKQCALAAGHAGGCV
jgi:hypothetical protein